MSAGKVANGRENHLLADLVYGGEVPLRMRINANEFKYDYLGDRMKPQSRENLRLLLGDVAEYAPDAGFTERTRYLMAGEPPAAWRFRTLAGFEAYTRWVLQAVEEALE